MNHEEEDNEIVSRLHLDLMEKILRGKERVFDMVDKDLTHVPDNERIYAYVALANSTEDSVVKVTKLKLEKEKNDISRVNGENHLELAKEIHRRRLETNRERKTGTPRTEDPERSFQPTEMELHEGEVVKGNDPQSFKDFKRFNPAAVDDDE